MLGRTAPASCSRVGVAGPNSARPRSAQPGLHLSRHRMVLTVRLTPPLSPGLLSEALESFQQALQVLHDYYDGESRATMATCVGCIGDALLALDNKEAAIQACVTPWQHAGLSAHHLAHCATPYTPAGTGQPRLWWQTRWGLTMLRRCCTSIGLPTSCQTWCVL